MTMLGGKLSLHDVDDVEKLARKALEERLRVVQLEPPLSEHERESALAHLVVVAWQASLRYDPNRYRSFASYCGHFLRYGFIDWLRKERGRTRWQFAAETRGQRRYGQAEHVRELVSLDEPAEDGERGLAELVAGGTLDGEADCSADLAWLLQEGSRSEARDLGPLREQAA